TNILAIGFAIAKVRYPSAPYWPTDALVTIAASLLSWIQAKRFQELSASYALAAHEISLIREQANRSMTEAQLSDFIADAESAFSREHTQWVARMDT
ncbi:MAG TPA: SLATT domain-containing protein, partial [Noviherbaspirillum sp.]|nr:SLATT domain-containing protein [Noviherbaspirillum sp.]